ncbi:hypothetical protein TRVL_08349 [Trypanosoma vivax]|uniref:Uncharacterized protein n=1 Tax=Trypanosoma vivax (strain Y486) TaxID=1055687 RepID=G0U2Y8_TRYVY|nr:hypothetical protein TRVL_08349 [Trypanosoma vivax]CCC50643.1 hypothetical protein, unlikely [Trypanosoma vivax Y486]
MQHHKAARAFKQCGGIRQKQKQKAPLPCSFQHAQGNEATAIPAGNQRGAPHWLINHRCSHYPASTISREAQTTRRSCAFSTSMAMPVKDDPPMAKRPHLKTAALSPCQEKSLTPLQNVAQCADATLRTSTSPPMVKERLHVVLHIESWDVPRYFGVVPVLFLNVHGSKAICENMLTADSTWVY